MILLPQLISALVGVVALIAIGVGVGVSLSSKNRTKSSNNTSGGSGSNGSNPVKQSDPNDPSTFQKDPRLIQSFYGLAYSPNGAIYPQCGAALPDVITDIQLMSQLTKVSLSVRTSRFSGLVEPPGGGWLFLGHLGAEESIALLLLDVYVCANSSRTNIAYSAVRLRL